MGAFISKEWNEMSEVTEAVSNNEEIKSEEKENREVRNPARVSHKKSLRERLRTRILKTDPRSETEGVDRTPIRVAGDTEVDSSLTSTPGVKPAAALLLEDPRSPGVVGQAGGGVSRTPLIVPLASQGSKEGAQDLMTPVRGAPPPSFELPPDTPGPDDIHGSPEPNKIKPIGNHLSTPATIPLGESSSEQASSLQVGKLRDDNRDQPSSLLAEKLKEVALTAMREQRSSTTAPAAEGGVEIVFDSPGPVVTSDRGGNDSSLLI